MDIREHQRVLRERYESGDEALQTITVRSGASGLDDPLHCVQRPDSVPTVAWRSGAHPAVGGEGDAPCSVDLLLAALAACQETTLRLVAANHGIELAAVDVVARADWDPRGTLGMGREYPIGLTGIRCATTVRLAADIDEERAARFLRSAERYCVVLSTLREAPPVEATLTII